MVLGESTWPGRVFKITLEGKVIGIIGKSGRNLKPFSGTRALLSVRERNLLGGELELARAADPAAPDPANGDWPIEALTSDFRFMG